MKRYKKHGQAAEECARPCPEHERDSGREQINRAASTAHGGKLLKTGAAPCVFLVIHVLIAAAATVLALCFLWAFSRCPGYDGVGNIRTAFLGAAVLCGVILLAVLYRLYHYQTNWIVAAYEDRISGMAIGLLIKRFDLPYGDIVGVSCRKRTLVLQTRNKNYICIVDDARDFYYLILGRKRFRVIIE